MSKHRHVAVAAAAIISSIGTGAAAGSAYAAAHSVAALKVGSVSIAGSAKSGKHQVLVTASGRPVYLLTGDSTKHPLCASSSCLSVWPAVTTSAKKPTLGKGVKGKLTVWTHGKLHQLVLDGHPLYTFVSDPRSGSANGQGLKSFGGTWKLLTASGTAFTSSSSKGGSPSYYTAKIRASGR